MVADPKGTELNQGYVQYKGIDNVGLKLGRQRINLDNQRFIGGVGWRQQEQTFDAFRAELEHDSIQASTAMSTPSGGSSERMCLPVRTSRTTPTC